jgi:hypothetical protein
MTAQTGTRTIQRTSAKSRQLCHYSAMQSRQRFHFVFLSTSAMIPPRVGSSNLQRGRFKEHEAERLGFGKLEV